ncbi:hypothetical protein B0T18DRAFT_227419 [Schizothecium vesticola]|uniref:Uncharacterized protein n=1 Tax=Schizothecium vesticola TaxID=314040 RepID=A0AA40K092_9PEZI|nr:hypothetical protein B0T18DRAFT_227419 [Schizothecium vesticola]
MAAGQGTISNSRERKRLGTGTETGTGTATTGTVGTRALLARKERKKRSSCACRAHEASHSQLRLLLVEQKGRPTPTTDRCRGRTSLQSEGKRCRRNAGSGWNLGCGPSHAAPRVNPAAIAPLRAYVPSPGPLSPSAANRAPLPSPHPPTGHRIGLPVPIIKKWNPWNPVGIGRNRPSIHCQHPRSTSPSTPNRSFAPHDDRRSTTLFYELAEIPTSWIPIKFTDTTSSRRRFLPWSLTFSSVARSNTVTQPLLTSVVTLSVPKHEPRWSRYVLPA